MCLLFDENFKQGRSVDFLFYFIFIFYLILNRVGRSGRFFFFTRFFNIYVPRFGKKKISDNANYLVCFILYDPSLDQRILLRKEQENILQLKIKLIGSFIYDKIQRQSTDFSPHYLRH